MTGDALAVPTERSAVRLICLIFRRPRIFQASGFDLVSTTRMVGYTHERHRGVRALGVELIAWRSESDGEAHCDTSMASCCANRHPGADDRADSDRVA